MRYRNVITGAEFESQSIISAPDWITVGAETPSREVAEDPIKEDPKPKTAAKKPAAKKKGVKK